MSDNAWALAGALAGALDRELEGGSLEIYKAGNVVVIAWRFELQGQKYGVTYAVDPLRLNQLRDPVGEVVSYCRAAIRSRRRAEGVAGDA